MISRTNILFLEHNSCVKVMTDYFCPICNSTLIPCKVLRMDDFQDLMPDLFFLEDYKTLPGFYCPSCQKAFEFDPIPF